MANLINLGSLKPDQLYYPAELIDDLRMLLQKAIVDAPAVDQFHTIITGVRARRQIGWVGEFGLVGVARQGCNPESQEASADTEYKWLDPKRWEVRLQQCYDELLETIAKYAMKLKNDEPDLTQTAYMNMVEDMLITAVYKMFWRLLWFGDMDAKNVSDGGVITNGVDVKYFNWLDGLWKQYFALATAEPVRRIVIPENNEATIAAAVAAFTPARAMEVASALKYNADIRLRSSLMPESGVKLNDEGSDELFAMCTRMFYDKLEQAITSQVQYTEAQRIMTIDGIQGIKWGGITFHPIDIWDEIIQKYQASGTGDTLKLNIPYRVVLTKKSNQVVAIPGENMVETVNSFYDKVSRNNFLEVMDAMDVTYGQDYMVELAY